MSEEYVRSKNIGFEDFKAFFGENGGGFGVEVIRGGLTLLQSETPDKALLKVKVHYPKSNKDEEYTYLLERDYEKGDRDFGFWVFRARK
jgi:hypothetical protein